MWASLAAYWAGSVALACAAWVAFPVAGLAVFVVCAAVGAKLAQDAHLNNRMPTARSEAPAFFDPRDTKK